MGVVRTKNSVSSGIFTGSGYQNVTVLISPVDWVEVAGSKGAPSLCPNAPSIGCSENADGGANIKRRQMAAAMTVARMLRILRMIHLQRPWVSETAPTGIQESH